MQRHVEPFRARWIDTDASGRTHFTAVFRWVEAAEIELFRELGLMDERDGYPRRRIEAEYLRPIGFDDEVELELSVDALGQTSISFVWTARVADDVVAHGVQVVVHVDASGRAAPLPDSVRKQLEGEA